MTLRDTNGTGIILINEGALLPPGAAIETEPFLPGWRAVKNLDRTALTQNIKAAHWTFFYLAGDIRATVLGSNRPATIRKAAKRALARQDGRIYNALEITSVEAKNFLGIPYVSVIAHSRHIQQDLCLVPVKTFASRIAVPQREEVVAMPLKPLISSL
jgi:hypothetical protein